MHRLIAFVIVGLCFLAFFRTYWIRYYGQGRRRGEPPPRHKATLFDVRDLLQEGEKEMAVQLYREIFAVSQKEAQKAVDDLENNLQS